MTYWSSEHFKALQKAWYQRLKDSGFQDAEEMIGEELKLKQRAACNVYQGADKLTRETKETYFRFVSQMVQETEFKREVDRLIMTRHAEGMKIKRICEELRRAGLARGRQTVRHRIRIYEMKWGLRQYTPRQLNYLKLG